MCVCGVCVVVCVCGVSCVVCVCGVCVWCVYVVCVVCVCGKLSVASYQVGSYQLFATKYFGVFIALVYHYYVY